MTSLTIEIIHEDNCEFTIIKKVNGKPLDVVGPQKLWDMNLSDQEFICESIGYDNQDEYDFAAIEKHMESLG